MAVIRALRTMASDGLQATLQTLIFLGFAVGVIGFITGTPYIYDPGTGLIIAWLATAIELLRQRHLHMSWLVGLCGMCVIAMIWNYHYNTWVVPNLIYVVLGSVALISALAFGVMFVFKNTYLAKPQDPRFEIR